MLIIYWVSREYLYVMILENNAGVLYKVLSNLLFKYSKITSQN